MEATIIEAEVIEALRSCFDPEILVNIYELGLIYDVKVDPSRPGGLQGGYRVRSCTATSRLHKASSMSRAAIPGTVYSN